MLANERLRRNQNKRVVESPIAVTFCFVVGPLEWIGAKAEEFGQT